MILHVGVAGQDIYIKNYFGCDWEVWYILFLHGFAASCLHDISSGDPDCTELWFGLQNNKMMHILL